MRDRMRETRLRRRNQIHDLNTHTPTLSPPYYTHSHNDTTPQQQTRAKRTKPHAKLVSLTFQQNLKGIVHPKVRICDYFMIFHIHSRSIHSQLIHKEIQYGFKNLKYVI